jgi:hypothetical protein
VLALRTMPGVRTELSETDRLHGGDAEQRRYLVCGNNPLALRLADELVSRYGVDVTVILASVEDGWGPRIVTVPGVEVIEAARLEAEVFIRADVAGAAALALVEQDDAGNLDAALLAR